MINRCFLIMAILAGSGCGNAPGCFSVSGKVLYKGEPAPGAVVYFHRESGVGPASPSIPAGVTDGDGTFKLACDGEGRGAPPGVYAVLVQWREAWSAAPLRRSRARQIGRSEPGFASGRIGSRAATSTSRNHSFMPK